MLDRLRRCSSISGIGGTAETEEAERSLISRLEPPGCMVLIMVDRLLVSEGTSSVDGCVDSPIAKELMVRVSAMEDAEVPSRDVSKDSWR